MRGGQGPGGWQGAPRGLLLSRVLSSAEAPGASETLPGISSSQRVTGLEPGVSYVFSLTAVQEGVRGAPAAVTQSPGMAAPWGGRGGSQSTDLLSNSAPPAACPRGRMDVVFLVHATRDSAHRAAAVKAALGRLVSALGPLGPQAVQVWPQRQPDPCLSRCPHPGLRTRSPLPTHRGPRVPPSPAPAPPPAITAAPPASGSVCPLGSGSPSLPCHPLQALCPLPQVGLLSYSHRASPLFPLNSSHDLGVILQKIRDVPYLDPSGNNLGTGCSGRGSGAPRGELSALGSDLSFLPGTAVASAQRYLLAPDAPGRRGQAPGVMVLLVDEPLRGDISNPIREAQAAGEVQGCWAGRLGGAGPAGCHAGPGPSVGLQVMALGLAGADLEQLRRLVPGTDPVQTFFAADDGPGLDRAVSGLAAALCQAASAAQVWKGLWGAGAWRRGGLAALGSTARP